MKKTFALLLGLTFNSICFGQKQMNPVLFPETNQLNSQEVQNLKKTVETQIQKMSMREKVGQLFLFGFAGQDINSSISELLTELKPGGIILFSRNIKNLAQVSVLISKAQNIALKNSSIPLLVAVDQEGGVVSRLATNPSIPSPMAVGLTENSEIAFSMGHEIGQLMRSIGFNMNLAPVMDLVDFKKDSFIGNRSFGKDPKMVAKLTRAFSEGLISVNVLPTAKHFPGTGDATADPHTGTTERFSTIEELKEKHILPFQAFMEMSPPTAIMMSHASFPKIDGKVPASLSPFFMKKLLKDELAFKGLIVTDDVQMEGAKQNSEASKTAVHALLSGADMVMMTWSKNQQKRAISDVISALKKGLLDQTKIEESVKKILMVKSYYKMNTRPNISIRDFKNLVQTSAISKLDSITLDTNLTKALASPKKRMASLQQNFTDLIVLSTHRSFIQSAKTVKITLPTRFFNVDKNLSTQGLKKFLEKNNRSLFIIPVYGKAMAQLISKLSYKYRKQVMVINFISPGIQDEFSDIETPTKSKDSHSSLDTDQKPSKAFCGVINLFSPHPLAGAKILEKLQTQGWIASKKAQYQNRDVTLSVMNSTK